MRKDENETERETDHRKEIKYSVSVCAMASSTSTSNKAAVLLYRSILKAHKKYLPMDMKALGDAYVKTEFRLHKTAESQQAQLFMKEWQMYLDQILVTARARNHAMSTEGSLETGDTINTQSRSRPLFEFGADLPKDANLSDDQRTQLEKLREEAEKTGRS